LEAKENDGSWEYKVHYDGWNSRHDDWVTKDAVICLLKEPSPANELPPSKTKPIMIPVKYLTAFVDLYIFEDVWWSFVWYDCLTVVSEPLSVTKARGELQYNNTISIYWAPIQDKSCSKACSQA